MGRTHNIHDIISLGKAFVFRHAQDIHFAQLQAVLFQGKILRQFTGIWVLLLVFVCLFSFNSISILCIKIGYSYDHLSVSIWRIQNEYILQDWFSDFQVQWSPGNSMRINKRQSTQQRLYKYYSLPFRMTLQRKIATTASSFISRMTNLPLGKNADSTACLQIRCAEESCEPPNDHYRHQCCSQTHKRQIQKNQFLIWANVSWHSKFSCVELIISAIICFLQGQLALTSRLLQYLNRQVV